MRDWLLPVVRNRPIGPGFRELVFQAEQFEACSPGQFLNIRVDGVFLRRPFSINNFQDDRLSILFQEVGPGTRALAAVPEGQQLSLLGPLGNGFPAPGGPALLVAGGIGIPPIRYLAQQYGGSRELTCCLGFRSAANVLLEEEFNRYARSLVVATDDGSYGIAGTVITALDSLPRPLPALGYACGPTPMLRALKAWGEENGVAFQLSLEAYMGCGFGVCLSCAVANPAGGYQRVCTDGPVFPADAVVL